jgi:DNA polymerase (family 10)
MGHVKNFELARLFYEMATLLEVRDESVFRVRAYQRAAQTLEALGEDVQTIAARGELQKLPGIGKDIAGRIAEYLAGGRIAQLEQLRGGLPPSFLGLLEIRGLGPRTARLLYDRLGVDTVQRLEQVCRSREIITVAGIREKTCENILEGLEHWKSGRARTLLARARGIADDLSDALRAHGGVDRLEVAGSIRRMRDTVKDIDLLVTSREPARVIDTLVSLPSVIDVLARATPRPPSGTRRASESTSAWWSRRPSAPPSSTSRVPRTTTCGSARSPRVAACA